MFFMSMTFQFRTRTSGILLGLFCLLGSVHLCAQNIQSAEAINASIAWKTPTEASQLLLIRIDNMNGQLPGFQVGSQPYDNVLRKVAYYKSILDEIEDGKPLATALENALPAAATLGYTKENNYTSKAVLRAIQEETRILLSN
jgi:uncharacterized SAM-binding protein YcdF (DUF218 family)